MLEIPNRNEELIASRYRIVSALGQGAWNFVYLALDQKRRNEPFAVKILKPEALKDEETVERFIREIQLTQQLEHRNIVRVFSSGKTEDSSYYLVSEYCDSGDLELYTRTLIENNKRVPFLRAVNILRFISRGLAHAHNRKIIHRDIKPENILLTTAQEVKIADFGIARSLRFNKRATQDFALGTPAYMSPEHYSGEDVGPWSDVYSLGILAYELLRGELPFSAEDRDQLMYQHCVLPTPVLTFRDSGIPCWMEGIVHKACEKDPAKRYKNAGEFSEEMEKLLAQELEEKNAIAKIFYFVRPNGSFCTFLTEKGISRKRSKETLMLFLAMVLIIGFLLLFKFSF